MLDYFIYDTNSPSCLSWSEDAAGTGKGSAERKAYTNAGSLNNKVWHILVTEGGIKYRSTASRIVWELFNGPIPEGMIITFLDFDTTNNNIENLVMMTRQTHNYFKAWKNDIKNVKLLPSGRWYATIRGHKSLGTYDTYEEACNVYRKELRLILTQRGIPL